MFDKEAVNMKAAIVKAAGKTPVYGEFATPVAKEGEALITVQASALSHLSKSRSTGEHYSSKGIFPAVAGIDGVGTTEDGRRVYFVMPDAPYGAFAEYCPVSRRRLVELPDHLDDVTAAALANPGMSAWASLVDRAKLAVGETVLINGATGTAGRLAVQLAKHLGAAKVIATGRSEEQLAEVKSLGADITIPFKLGITQPTGAKDYEEALKGVLSAGVDVVIDYLYGESFKTVIMAAVKTADDAKPIRMIHVGAASGEQTLELPGAALRAAAISLMGSGLGSVSNAALLAGIKNVFELARPAGLKIATKVAPLADVEKVWEKAEGKPRLVFTMR
jgi:NADPH:quinone reductase-like Zn-dependent oxidoreductase